MTDILDNDISSDTERLPEYLQSYDALVQHIRAQFDGLSNTEKGDRFAHFVKRVIPQTEAGAEFNTPELNAKKSNDEGVDLVANSKDGKSVLYIQAKMWVDRADALDSIISKFESFTSHHHNTKTSQATLNLDEEPVQYALVTLSQTRGILNSYTSKRFSSKKFYDESILDNRIHVIDGSDLFTILQAAHRKINQIPSNLVLNLVTDAIHVGNVYLGVVDSTQMQSLYKQFGDSLFFENVRDFLGLGRKGEGRTTPNLEIIKTVQNEPGKMLERNNGIVIRAEAVKWGDTHSQLRLSRGSVVNGCQTTMCLVENAKQGCCVPVKVVQTNASWDVAKAANYQNSVADIDLDLAQHLRPQLAKRAAMMSGVHLDDGETSVFQIIDTIYDRKVAYDETRLLYIGLFSRIPNNVFRGNYTELVQDIIDRFYQEDTYGEHTFETLFALQEASQEGFEEAKKVFTNPSYVDMFKRFYKEDSPSYRCFVSILAICSSVNINIAERMSDPVAEYQRMRQFFQNAQALLINRRKRFHRYYVLAVKAWMQEVMAGDADVVEITRDMHSASRKANFTNLLRRISMDADIDDKLHDEAQEFENQG